VPRQTPTSLPRTSSRKLSATPVTKKAAAKRAAGTKVAQVKKAVSAKKSVKSAAAKKAAPTKKPSTAAGKKAAGKKAPAGKKAAPGKKAASPPVRLEAGDRAPVFSLPDQDGTTVALRDFAGSPVVVYFYPADDTPGCTKEACQFNDNLRAFSRSGVAVVGVSPDGAGAHTRFRAKYGLRFPLLTDADHDVMTRYGAWGTKTMYGRTMVGVIRSTFLVGADGRIARAWYHVKADGHADKVLAELGT